jgi:hypothetical protein
MITAPADADVRSTLTPARRRRRRRETENPDYAAFIRRILRAYTRRIAAGDLEALGELARLRDELNGHLTDAVAGLRHEPNSYSWAQIADALGVSGPTAFERFRKVGGTRRPGAQPANLR